MKEPIILENYDALGEYIKNKGGRKILLVCGNSAEKTGAGSFFAELKESCGVQVVRFSDFSPNPSYASVVKGVEVYRKEGCTLVAAVGGGSAMDVAKCIKLFAEMPDGDDYVLQEITPNDIPLIAIPTTAGTGSEATRYSIIYYNGSKFTVTHESSIPDAVLFDPSALDTLPMYHKKAAMLDALCHAVESLWSVHSTAQSKDFASMAIRLLFASKDTFIAGDESGHKGMLMAANIAGKAINITGTTAGHAMCYKLTGLYGIAHGHAAALCVDRLFAYMYDNLDKCTDPRGSGYLAQVFDEIASAMGCASAAEASRKFSALLDEMGLGVPKPESEADFDILKNSVNADRLKNHPTALDVDVIEKLYREIM